MLKLPDGGLAYQRSTAVSMPLVYALATYARRNLAMEGLLAELHKSLHARKPQNTSVTRNIWGQDAYRRQIPGDAEHRKQAGVTAGSCCPSRAQRTS